MDYLTKGLISMVAPIVGSLILHGIAYVYIFRPVMDRLDPAQFKMMITLFMMSLVNMVLAGVAVTLISALYSYYRTVDTA